MIPDYKLYHGAVLVDIVDKVDGSVTFCERIDRGRLLNYVINDRVGLQVKYSKARLRPWIFSFPEAHLDHLRDLLSDYPTTFVVLVCHTDGLVCISASELLPFLASANGGQAWLRVSRRKREMYRLFGPQGEFGPKLRITSDPIVAALREVTDVSRPVLEGETERLFTS